MAGVSSTNAGGVAVEHNWGVKYQAPRGAKYQRTGNEQGCEVPTRG